jgi:tetratricopeptide (TPR) repeat protein
MESFQASYLHGTKLPRAWAWLLISLFLSTTFYKASGQQEASVAQKEIERDRLAIGQAHRLHLNDGQLGRLWAQIGSDEEHLGQMDQAETAYVHALELFEHDPSLQADYAVTLTNLGTLYEMTHREQESLNCRKRSINIFQKLGDPLQIARGEAHLTDAYLALGKYKEAERHARTAIDRFVALPHAPAEDRASAMAGYAFASCLANHCDEGLIAARQAMELTRAASPANSFPIGQVHVVLGYAEWRTGDNAQAETDLRSGIDILRHALYPSHPLIMQALDLYRRYLLEAHREAEAKQIGEEEKSPASDTTCANCKVSVYGLRGK